MVEFEYDLISGKMRRVLVQAFKLIKSSKRKICLVYSFIHIAELKIAWFYYVIWRSELKIHSKQGQIKELSLKAKGRA